MTKINLRIIFKPHAHLQTTTKTPVKIQKDRHKTVGGVAHTRYPLSIHFDSTDKVQNADKVTEIILRIRSKPLAYLQTMTKIPVKFQKNPHKTVGGVAHTRYPLSIPVYSIRTWKIKFKMWKRWQKLIGGLHHNHFITFVRSHANFRVSYPNRIITRVKCIGYIEKGVLNGYLGSNSDPCYIQNSVIMHRVIKMFRCISKPHAHIRTMTKTPVKFKRDQHKTVGGVAHTRYLL